MNFLITIFWISLAILFYCYIGYGIIVFLVNIFRSLIKKKRIVNVASETPVTMIVAAFNEASVLQQKIDNTLAINYPEGLLQLIVITDGSTDGSDELVRLNPAIRLLHIPERKGKYAAIKRAMREIRTPVVVFSDANAILNPDCITRIVKHYTDPVVGGVAGEKKILRGDTVSAVGEAEGIYWKYESFLKKLDANLNTVTGAAGELFSIRTELFREQDDDIILDDFVISMQVCLQGYKIAYEPGAYATELPSISINIIMIKSGVIDRFVQGSERVAVKCISLTMYFKTKGRTKCFCMRTIYIIIDPPQFLIAGYLRIVAIIRVIDIITIVINKGSK